MTVEFGIGQQGSTIERDAGAVRRLWEPAMRPSKGPMGRRLLALLIAVSTLLTMAAPVSADAGGPSWSTIHRGYLTRVGGAYKHYIPVCLETSVYGPTWNVSLHPNHARMVNAIDTWNAIGGELFYYPYSVTCQSLRDGGGPFLSIRKLSQSPLGTTTGTGTFCVEKWSNSCSKEVVITYDSTPAYPWWTGYSAPPDGTYDFWSLMLHELGHSMRCGGDNQHSPNSADVMYATLGHHGVDDRKIILTANDKLCYTHYYGTTH